MKLRLLPVMVTCTVLFFGCDKEIPKPDIEENPSDAMSNRIDIPPAVRNNLGITFTGVQRREIRNTLRLPGRFELNPSAQQEYRVILPGVVELAVGELDEIEPGSVLYHLRSPAWLELLSRIRLAEANFRQVSEKLKISSERIEALQKADFKRADLQAQVASLSADVVKARAELNDAASQAAMIFNLSNNDKNGGMTAKELLHEVNGIPHYQTIASIPVKALKSGIVHSLSITDGSFADQATLVMKTVNPRNVRFRAMGLQGDLDSLSNPRSARLVQALDAETDYVESVNAGAKIVPIIDPGTRTVTVLATPAENRPWIMPGKSGFLELTVDETENFVLAIPESAVVKDGLTHVFFKRDSSNANKAIRIEADLGISDGRWVEIKSDIGPNDQVVINGAYELKLATSQSGVTQKGGHFHADGTFHGEH